MSRAWKWAAGVAGVVVFACVLILAQVQESQADKIAANVADLKSAPVAVVLGASVKSDGTASDALSDRVLTAVDLYRRGTIKQLFMTGDDGAYHVDEVASMRKMALDAGVPTSSVMTDGHGYRTYESCERAVRIFHITDAIIVTQRFHLGRALYLCAHFGMHVQGFSADRQTYQRIVYFTLRDWAASLKAWWDVNVQTPKPVVGD